jgi:hypothetical protein
LRRCSRPILRPRSNRARKLCKTHASDCATATQRETGARQYKFAPRHCRSFTSLRRRTLPKASAMAGALWHSDERADQSIRLLWFLPTSPGSDLHGGIQRPPWKGKSYTASLTSLPHAHRCRWKSPMESAWSTSPARTLPGSLRSSRSRKPTDKSGNQRHNICCLRPRHLTQKTEQLSKEAVITNPLTGPYTCT